MVKNEPSISRTAVAVKKRNSGQQISEYDRTLVVLKELALFVCFGYDFSIL